MKFCNALFVRIAALGGILLLTYSLGLSIAVSPSVAVPYYAEQDDMRSDQPDVRIVVNEIPPFAYFAEDGSATGLWVNQIKRMMAASGLEYSIEIVPWSRAFAEATTLDNVLIAHLDRLPTREDDYHWLYKLDNQPFHLFTLKNSPYADMSLEDAINSDGRAVCIHKSSQCAVLSDLGFPDDRIWAVADYKGEPLSTLVWYGRAQFWLDDIKWLASRPLEDFGMKPADFKSLGVVQDLATYLAAHKGLKPELLSKVQSSIETFKDQHRDDAPPDSIFIATTETRPYFYKLADNIVAGEWVSPVENYLAHVGLKAIFHLTPWRRVLHETAENTDVLIANFDRTPEREDLYHWLLPLYTKQNQVITIKDGPYDGMTREQAISSGGLAMCLVGSQDCDTLRAVGFPEDSIVEMRDFLSDPLGKMLYTGRVAFTLGDLEIAGAEMKAFGLDPNRLSPLFTVDQITSYLAAPKHLDPELLMRLQISD